jgi:chromosome segregation ATPase
LRDVEGRLLRESELNRQNQLEIRTLTDRLTNEQQSLRAAQSEVERCRSVDNERSQELQILRDKENSLGDRIMELESKMSRQQSNDEAKIRTLTFDLERESKRLAAIQRDLTDYKVQVHSYHRCPLSFINNNLSSLWFLSRHQSVKHMRSQRMGWLICALSWINGVSVHKRYLCTDTAQQCSVCYNVPMDQFTLLVGVV